MKKIISLIFIISLFLVGCSMDSEQFYGEWDVFARDYSKGFSPEPDYIGSMTFYEDGTYTKTADLNLMPHVKAYDTSGDWHTSSSGLIIKSHSSIVQEAAIKDSPYSTGENEFIVSFDEENDSIIFLERMNEGGIPAEEPTLIFQKK